MAFVLSSDRNMHLTEDTDFRDVLYYISFHEERTTKEDEIRRNIETRNRR